MKSKMHMHTTHSDLIKNPFVNYHFQIAEMLLYNVNNTKAEIDPCGSERKRRITGWDQEQKIHPIYKLKIYQQYSTRTKNIMHNLLFT